MGTPKKANGLKSTPLNELSLIWFWNFGIEDARVFCREFFTWYNTSHYHSGLAHFTPEDVHYGRVETKREARQETLLKAFATHPERFVKGAPRAAVPPREVWINKPKKEDGQAKNTTKHSPNQNEILCKRD